MKVISKLILEDDLTETTIHDKSRTTVRAIITKDNLVLMLYSKYYNDYTFPGGGVKEDENLIESLKRELKEEIGAESIENIEEYGQISELKYSHNLGSKNTYLQTSYYYKLNVNQFGKPSPLLREE